MSTKRGIDSRVYKDTRPIINMVLIEVFLFTFLLASGALIVSVKRKSVIFSLTAVVMFTILTFASLNLEAIGATAIITYGAEPILFGITQLLQVGSLFWMFIAFGAYAHGMIKQRRFNRDV